MITHDELFERYINDLRNAKEASERWWKTLIAEEVLNLGDLTKAENSVRERWPFGPTSHPWVIAVFRKYYLLCENLNLEETEINYRHERLLSGDDEENWGNESEEITSIGYVSPRDFTLNWLAGEKTIDLYEFMQFMVFLPIGIKNDVCV